MNSTHLNVGQNVRIYRKQRGLTQAQLAEKIGKTTETISHLETGAVSTKLSTLDDIANALNIKIYQLFINNAEHNLILNQLSEDETNLLCLFRNLTSYEKKYTIKILQALTEASKEKNVKYHNNYGSNVADAPQDDRTRRLHLCVHNCIP